MVTIISRPEVIQQLILSFILMTLYLYLNTRLVHDLYSKSKEGHLSMIDY